MASQVTENEFVSSILSEKLTVKDIIRTNFDANWLTYNGELYDWLLNYWQINNKLPTIELVETRYPTYKFQEVKNAPLEILDALRKNSEMDRLVSDISSATTLLTKTANANNAVEFLLGRLQKYDNNTEQDVFDLADDTDNDALYQLYKKRYELMQTQGFVGIPTGFGSEFDRWLNGGSIGGNLYGILAPLGVGKTWSMQIVGAACMKAGKSPFMLMLEGSYEKEGYRALTAGTTISNSALHTAQLQLEDMERATKQFQRLANKYNSHFYIAVHGNRNVYTPSVLRQKIIKYNPDLVIVDYLSLMGVNSGDKLIDEWKVAVYISSELKKMSVAFNIPIWVVLQGNRGSNDKEELSATDSSHYNPLRDFDTVTGLSKVKDKEHLIRLNSVKGRDNENVFKGIYRTNWNTGKVEFVEYIIEDDHF